MKHRLSLRILLVPFLLFGISLSGCGGSSSGGAETLSAGRFAVVLSANSGARGTSVPIGDVESLVVTIDEILLAQETDDGVQQVSIFSDTIQVDLITLQGFPEVIDSALIPVGSYSSVTLVISDATLLLAGPPPVFSEDVVLPDGGRFTFAVDFVVALDQEGILQLDVGAINIIQTGPSEFEFIPDFQVDVSLDQVAVQVQGEIVSVDLVANTFVLSRDDINLVIEFSTAAIFLPDDLDVATGIAADLTPGAEVLVVGTLSADETVSADTVEIDEFGEGTELRVCLAGTSDDPLASGHADYEVLPDRVRLSIEVEDVSSASSLTFLVDGVEVGALPVVLGTADLNLDSRLGDAVPEITAETLIEVVDADTDTVVLTTNGAPLVCGGGGDGEPGDGEILELRLPLTPTALDPLASGRADFEVRPDRRRLSIEVEDISAATDVTFFVDGVDLGTLAVELGFADLNLDSRLGDVVPEVGETTVIEVTNAATGDVLLSRPSDGPPPDDETQILELDLNPTEADPLASGRVDFEVLPDRRVLSIEVEDIGSASGVTFLVDGVDLGTLLIVLGRADLNLDSRLGDVVPEITLDTLVEVVDAADGTVLLRRGGVG